MKLISFDIGIKNMAYCIFVIDASVIDASVIDASVIDVSGVSPSFVVQDWRVINLMDQVEVEKPVCLCPLKSKKINKPCGHKAVFEKSGKYYCAKHAKELASGMDLTYILPEKSITPATIKKMSKEGLIELCKKWSILAPFGSTKPEILDYVIKWFSERCFKPIVAKKTASASETDLITIGRNMKTQLELIVQMEGATHVIMENQISPLAGRMKTIQGMLAQYYIMQDPSPYIEFISSANKLKDFANVLPLENRVISGSAVVDQPLLGQVETAKTLRQIYTKHKTDSVAICKKILEKNPELGSWTLDDPTLAKKKDDLADCFLQGIWYLKHAKYIMCAENLKINLV